MLIPPLIPVTVAFLLGVLPAHLGSWATAWVWGLGAVCLAVSVVTHRRAIIGLVALLGLWACLGLLRAAQWSHLPPDHLAHRVTAEPSTVVLHGVVVDDPIETFAPGEFEQQVAVVRVRHARLGGTWEPRTGLVRAKLEAPRRRVAYGDEVLLEGRASSVSGPGNPGQFDWRAALARQQIHALLTVQPLGGVVVLRQGQGAWWMAAVARLRRRLERVLDATFPPEQAGLLRSLLLGQRVALNEELKRAFMETGTIHLLVISGFNVGLIAGILELLLRFMGLSLRPRLVISAFCLFGYWALTGMQPPVTRATIMAWMVLGAVGMDWVVNWPNLLAAAALAIVAIQPSQLSEPSFQLSFGAVVSLLALTAPLRRVIEPRLPPAPEWLRRYVAVSLASTTAVWLGLWPMLAWYFHLLAPISVVANLVLVPLVSVLVACGTVLAFAGTIAYGLLAAFRGPLEWLLGLSIACVQGLQRVPFGYWPVGHPSWPVIIGYYGLLILSLLHRRLRLSRVGVAACWLLAVTVWTWSAVIENVRRAAWLEVTVLDVGHGDAIAIRTPNRQTLLVDAGTREAGRYVVAPFLRYRGWSALDALVLTHADEDHLGGAGAVMDAAQVRRLFTNGFAPDTGTARQAFDAAARRTIPRQTLAAGQQVLGDTRITLTVLHPPAGGIPGATLAENENSLVLRVAYGQVSVLLCADLDDAGLPWLARWGAPLRSTVLKVPHHGSRLGPWGLELFARVHPSLAVISVGRLHGLPAVETLQDLAAVGARTLTTRQAGAVTLLTDGRRLIVRTFRPFDSGPGLGREALAQDVARTEAKGRPERAKRVEGRRQWSPELARGAPPAPPNI